MDSVRFGRVLGLGARHAAKTLVKAVDAATTEKPATQPRPASSRSALRPIPTAGNAGSAVASKAARTATQAREVQRGVRRGSKRFGEAVWNPFVRLSGVLWLEVTGVFFGIFALFAGQGVWRTRLEWQAGGHRERIIGAAVMTLLFSYFCVSSFVKAHKRGKGR